MSADSFGNEPLPVTHYLLIAWARWARDADKLWIEHNLRHRSLWDFLPSAGRQAPLYLHKHTNGEPITSFRLAMVEQWMSGSPNERGLSERNPKLHQVICAKYLGKCGDKFVFSEHEQARLLFPDQGVYAYGLYQTFIRAGWRTLAAYIKSLRGEVDNLGYMRTLFAHSRQMRKRKTAA